MRALLDYFCFLNTLLPSFCVNLAVVWMDMRPSGTVISILDYSVIHATYWFLCVLCHQLPHVVIPPEFCVCRCCGCWMQPGHPGSAPKSALPFPRSHSLAFCPQLAMRASLCELGAPFNSPLSEVRPPFGSKIWLGRFPCCWGEDLLWQDPSSGKLFSFRYHLFLVRAGRLRHKVLCSSENKTHTCTHVHIHIAHMAFTHTTCTYHMLHTYHKPYTYSTAHIHTYYTYRYIHTTHAFSIQYTNTALKHFIHQIHQIHTAISYMHHPTYTCHHFIVLQLGSPYQHCALKDHIAKPETIYILFPSIWDNSWY